MNYVIINGVNSNTIQGLLIQSLPPISKPLMRTEVVEIDGRDGDIVYELGYSAYDKQISIGLHGDFDIDQVIKFFTGKGTVIFSNEPDKYYNFQIINQIDYQRLLRYRTATVTIHVQPYKYAVEDMDILRNITAKTNAALSGISCLPDGTHIHISGTSTGGMRSYWLNPVTVKDGDQLLYKVTGTGSATIALYDNDSTTQTITGSATGWTLDDLSFAEGDAINSIRVTVANGSEVDLYLTLYLIRNASERYYGNLGNTVAKPKFVIVGKGIFVMSINGNACMTFQCGDTRQCMIVDTDGMNVRLEDGTWFNRNITAQYDLTHIQPDGACAVTFELEQSVSPGEVIACACENQSRWI